MWHWVRGNVQLLAVGFIVSTFGAAYAADAKREVVGILSNGEKIESIELSNEKGVSATILSFGATLQSFKTPDRNGIVKDIILGHGDPSTYQSNPNYLGVTVGRYANRIHQGRFSLDGKEYTLPQNNGVNSLHGGGNAFDLKNWNVVSVKSGPQSSVTLALKSPDGENGYPGNLDVVVTYSLDNDSSLSISFVASTDQPTIVNMTNHALFNLAGEGSPEGAMLHKLTIPAGHYTPVTPSLIPTGELRSVVNSVFDFRKPRRLADGVRDGSDDQIRLGRGYDHNFALDKGLTNNAELVACLEDPISGRVLEVLSTEPGLQLYTGNFIDGTIIGKANHIYRMGDGIALEPQKFPNAPNEPSFISARVDPGKPYRHEMVYRVSSK
jgi:aldose 1-epimerase